LLIIDNDVLIIDMTTSGTENLIRQSTPGALSASRIVLQILIVLNWAYGAIIVGILILSFALGWPSYPPSPENNRLLLGMRAVAVLGILSVPLHLVFLRRLLDIVESVRVGDPFVRQNAARLQTIGWVLLGLQVLGLAVGLIARVVTTDAHPFRVHAGFSTGGWLTVLLLFVLARVFGEGARMRDELEGTV
jgi:hypothetical protein